MEKQYESEILGQDARKAKNTPCSAYMHFKSEQGIQRLGYKGEAFIYVGRRERISPAALFTGHRPFGVVLTVTEVRHEVVKPNNSTTAKYSVVAGNLQL